MRHMVLPKLTASSPGPSWRFSGDIAVLLIFCWNLLTSLGVTIYLFKRKALCLKQSTVLCYFDTHYLHRKLRLNRSTSTKFVQAFI